MSAPSELIELLGQLRLLHPVIERMADDANDAWCEEGGGWDPGEIEWVADVDAYLHRITPELIELMQAGSKLVPKG